MKGSASILADERYWLTDKGWLLAGYQQPVRCMGDGERSCPAMVRPDKPFQRCEFCTRTVAMREPVAA